MSRSPRYPRRRFIRTAMRLLGRILLPVFARLELEGQDRFPRKGPLIVVGNHTGALEVVLLTVYAPRIIEYLGSVDIPHEEYIASFIYTYGFIPVFRGNASRASMEAGLEVLRQDAVLGLFPEGGIWEPEIRRAQAGVAWLSYRGEAPVLPIGFGSTRGALGEMLRLRRPRLTMHIGEVIPALNLAPGVPQKQQLQEAADRIVDGIWALVPAGDQAPPIRITGEHFQFEVVVVGADGAPVPVPASHRLENGPALSKVIHRSTLFNNLLQNLRLPVAPLKNLHHHPPLEDLLTATQSILTYLRLDNPFYFTYRYGPVEGAAMQAGIQEFHDLNAWALERGYVIHARPVRQYRRTDTGEVITIAIPEEENKW